jgi:hypothetical protein
VADLIVDVMVARALAGDVRFLGLIWDRVEGPVQAVEPVRDPAEPPRRFHNPDRDDRYPD